MVCSIGGYFLDKMYFRMCGEQRSPPSVLLTPKVALIAMQRPTPRCTRHANCRIVLARLRTAAVTTVCIRSRPLTRPLIDIWSGCAPPSHPAIPLKYYMQNSVYIKSTYHATKVLFAPTFPHTVYKCILYAYS